MNGRNPLVTQAGQLHLPMPYEDEDYEYEDYEDYEDEYEDGEGFDTSAWEDGDMPEPLSEDEQFNGVNRPPPAEQKPRRRRRMPPMPKTPKPKVDPNKWVPPFEVLPDGTVTGPKLSKDGDPFGTELPDGFDESSVMKGTFEGVTQMFLPPGSR